MGHVSRPVEARWSPYAQGMLTTSHARWTELASSGRRHPNWSVLGGVLPDAAAWLVAGGYTLRGTPPENVLEHTYHRSPFREIHMAVHAVWIPAAVALAAPLGSRGRALAGGWLGHLAVDYLTHHDDAWAPGWPLSSWRWRAPISHWQHEHHARLYGAADLAGLALSFRRRPTALGVVAVGLALVSLGKQLTAPSRPLGLVSDPAGRGRDLDRWRSRGDTVARCQAAPGPSEPRPRRS